MDEKRFDFSDLCINERRELVRAAKYIDRFIEEMEAGSSYWVGSDGVKRTTDVGYGCEFWTQLRDYIYIQCGNEDPDLIKKSYTVVTDIGERITVTTDAHTIKTIIDCINSKDIEVMTVIRHYVDSIFLATTTGRLVIDGIDAAMLLILLNSTIVISRDRSMENRGGYNYILSIPSIEKIFNSNNILTTNVTIDITNSMYGVGPLAPCPTILVGFNVISYFTKMSYENASIYIGKVPMLASIIHDMTAQFYRKLIADRADATILEERRYERELKAANEKDEEERENG